MAARILVIEDNAPNMELMRYLLCAFGHDVIAAVDGEDGVRHAMGELPDLVLCDLQLPGIDGFEVLRRLRGEPAVAAVPVLAVTALAMVGDRDKALAAGFDGYLSKPIDPRQFVADIEHFLPRKLHGSSRIAAPAAVPAAGELRHTGRTLLVVDNLRANLELATSLFESSGYRVVAASDIGEALRLAREAAPDLILSDVCMPAGSGYELIAALRADPRLRDIPFVFITSTLTDEASRQKGLALGAAGFLFRPIEPEELLAQIEAHLPEPSAR